MRNLVFLGLLALGACAGQNQAADLAAVQGLVAAGDAALQAEKDTLLAALPPADRPAATIAISAFDAGAAGIAAVDPTKTTAAQATAAFNAFLGASGPVVAALPWSAATKAEINTGIAVTRAFLPYIPAMFPVVVTPPAPSPAPTPAPVVIPAPPPAPPAPAKVPTS